MTMIFCYVCDAGRRRRERRLVSTMQITWTI